MTLRNRRGRVPEVPRMSRYGIESDVPESYARRLAGYISDASTIRVRTLDRFGQSPSVEQIKAMQAEHNRLASRQWNYMQAPKYDNKFPELYREPKLVPVEKVDQGLTFDAPPWRAPASLKKDPPEMVADVSRAFGLTYAEMIGPGRVTYLKNVRFLIATLLIERGNSTTQVGEWLGGRDHTTIMNAVRKFPRIMADNPPIALAYEHFKREWG